MGREDSHHLLQSWNKGPGAGQPLEAGKGSILPGGFPRTSPDPQPGSQITGNDAGLSPSGQGYVTVLLPHRSSAHSSLGKHPSTPPQPSPPLSIPSHGRIQEALYKGVCMGTQSAYDGQGSSTRAPLPLGFNLSPTRVSVHCSHPLPSPSPTTPSSCQSDPSYSPTTLLPATRPWPQRFPLLEVLPPTLQDSARGHPR